MSPTTKPLVFVTGSSGFVGTHVVLQLLEAGYPVLGAARGAKVAMVEKVFAKYPGFKAVNVPDIASGDLSLVLKGVGAIIHVAAPLPGRADAETALRSAEEGSVHVLREGLKAGVKKAVVTSSMVTFDFMKIGPFGVDDFNPITKDAFNSGDPWAIYIAEKKFADLAVLKFADAHPEVDITILGPSWVFGPFVPGFGHIVPTPDFKPFSTNGFIYALLRTDNTFSPSSPGIVDVRDIAKSHVLALTSKPASAVGHKRFPVTSLDDASYSAAINFIAAERPELKGRLLDADKAPTFAFETGILDAAQQALEDVVGFKRDSYIGWKKTILDTVDSLIALEDLWKQKGYTVNTPRDAPM